MAENSYEKIFNLLSILEEITDFEKTLQIITDYLKNIFHSNEVSILMVNPRTETTIKTIYSDRSNRQDTNTRVMHDLITGWVLKNKKTFLSNEVPIESNINRLLANQLSEFSIMCSPLKSSSKIIGVIFIKNKNGEIIYDVNDKNLLEHFAYAAAPFLNSTQNIYQYFTPSLSSELLTAKYSEMGLFGKSRNFLEVLKSIDIASKCSVRVMIQGKSGTGKELVAKAIHKLSSRNNKKFIAIDCGALPSQLIESELFGHVKGAFTGADTNRKGLIEEADGGTLFMDEVTNLPFETQSKLLRVLQENEFRPLGSNETKKIDVRIISASGSPIKELIEQKKFREDLYYRLFVFPIYMPLLNERKDDIPILINHFLEKFCLAQNKRIEGFSDECMAAFIEHDWIGNIRELENYIERIVSGINDETNLINVDQLPADIKSTLFIDTDKKQSNDNEKSLSELLQNYETKIINDVLKNTGWNQSEAARQLGIPEQTLRYKMKKLNITKSPLDYS